MSSNAQLSRQVHEQQKLLSWMQGTAAEIRQLSVQKTAPHRNSDISLLSLVDRTIKRQQLNAYLSRLEPQGSNKVQIWFKQVPFDSLIRWLQQLENQHNIAIVTISAQKQASPGTVDTRVVLGDR
jgi:general secretion pathway protein M